ncbi:MAG: DUF6644 family protein [Bryobacteraceae bacterium]
MREICQILDTSWLAETVRASTWAFALLEVIHLIGITLMLGTLCVLDLRLMGIGMKAQTVSQVAEDTHPWTLGGLILAASSGILLAISEALRLYESPPFVLKMILFIVAVIFTYAFQRKMTKAEQPTGGAKLGALLSLVLWFGVGFAGRAIAFY